MLSGSSSSLDPSLCSSVTHGRHLTAQQVFPLGAVGCVAHTGEVQSVAQDGVHPAEDVRVTAGGQGRRLGVRAAWLAGVVSL